MSSDLLEGIEAGVPVEYSTPGLYAEEVVTSGGQDQTDASLLLDQLSQQQPGQEVVLEAGIPAQDQVVAATASQDGIQYINQDITVSMQDYVPQAEQNVQYVETTIASSDLNQVIQQQQDSQQQQQQQQTILQETAPVVAPSEGFVQYEQEQFIAGGQQEVAPSVMQGHAPATYIQEEQVVASGAASEGHQTVVISDGRLKQSILQGSGGQMVTMGGSSTHRIVNRIPGTLSQLLTQSGQGSNIQMASGNRSLLHQQLSASIPSPQKTTFITSHQQQPQLSAQQQLMRLQQQQQQHQRQQLGMQQVVQQKLGLQRQPQHQQIILSEQPEQVASAQQQYITPQRQQAARQRQTRVHNQLTASESQQAVEQLVQAEADNEEEVVLLRENQPSVQTPTQQASATTYTATSTFSPTVRGGLQMTSSGGHLPGQTRTATSRMSTHSLGLPAERTTVAPVRAQQPAEIILKGTKTSKGTLQLDEKMLRQVLANSGYKEDSLIQLPNGQCIRLAQPKSAPTTPQTLGTQVQMQQHRQPVARTTHRVTPRQTMSRTHVSAGNVHSGLVGGRQPVRPKSPGPGNLQNVLQSLATGSYSQARQVQTTVSKGQALTQVVQNSSNMTPARTTQSAAQMHYTNHSADTMVSQHNSTTHAQTSNQSQIIRKRIASPSAVDLHEQQQTEVHYVEQVVASTSAGGGMQVMQSLQQTAQASQQPSLQETGTQVIKSPISSPKQLSQGVSLSQSATGAHVPMAAQQPVSIPNRTAQSTLNTSTTMQSPVQTEVPSTPQTLPPETPPSTPGSALSTPATPSDSTNSQQQVPTSQPASSKGCNITPAGKSPAPEVAPEVTPEVEREKGKDYIIEYSNGKKYLATWTGQYFSVKSMMSETGELQPVMGINQTSTVQTPTASTGDQQLAVKSGCMGGKQQPQGNVADTPTPGAQARRPLHPDRQDLGDHETTTEEPVTPKPQKRPYKPTEPGKFAVCNYCGQMSADYNNCDSCSRELPENPRYYQPNKAMKTDGSQKSAADARNQQILAAAQQKTSQVLVVTQQQPQTQPGAKKFYGHKMAVQGQVYGSGGNKASPKSRGRPPKKSATEPVVVSILSSDDEDETAEHKQQRLQQQAATSQAGSDKSLSRRLRMEDPTGKVVQREPDPAPKMSRSLCVSLKSHALRIGSFQGIPFEPIVFTLTGIQINMQSGNKIYNLFIMGGELVHVMTNFTAELPAVFIYTNPGCAARLRSRCGMSSSAGSYYDPNSTNEQHKRITILLNEVPSLVDTTSFKQICRHCATQQQRSNTTVLRLEEVSPTIVNEILGASWPDLVLRTVQHTTQPPVIPINQSPAMAMARGTLTQNSMVLQVGANGGIMLSQVANPALAGAVLPGREPGEDDDDEDLPDRSRSPSPPRIFAGPILKLLTFPPPPATGGIAITNEDLFCLNDGEFLNDVIIDFYLKYLLLEILGEKDRKCTHLFSSFFYRRLTQKQTRRGTDDACKSIMEKRHNRVKTWTRHVDIFSKDFIIVPINESAHWYLALICFPYLKKSETTEIEVETKVPLNRNEEKFDGKQITASSTTKEAADESATDAKRDVPEPEKVRKKPGRKPKSATISKILSSPKPQFSPRKTRSSDVTPHSAPRRGRKPAVKKEEKVQEKASVDPTPKKKYMSKEEEIIEKMKERKNKRRREEEEREAAAAKAAEEEAEKESETAEEEEKEETMEEEEPMDTGEKAVDEDTVDTSVSNQPSDEREVTDDETKEPDEQETCSNATIEKEDQDTKEEPDFVTVTKTVKCLRQPCILLFDSLAGPSRSGVVKILRDYLQMEWNAKKKDTEGARSFDKDTVKGGTPRCPQQNNFSDCGIYVLQYVESFFENPILDYSMPIKSTESWFTDEKVQSKRDDLRNLILTLQQKYNPELDYDPTKDGCGIKLEMPYQNDIANTSTAVADSCAPDVPDMPDAHISNSQPANSSAATASSSETVAEPDSGIGDVPEQSSEGVPACTS